MKVIWYIYGDIFATYPNLTIGTAVGGVLTQIPWNTPTEANGQHHASAANPLGMTTKAGDPGITQSWQDKRVIDFGDYDDPINDPDNPSSWYGDDIYIDDVDNPIGDTQDFTVRVIGNTSLRSPTARMRLNNAMGINWFSANPNHFQYTNNYGGTDDALNMARLLNGGTNNLNTGIQQNWHARNANPQAWKEFVVYKVIMDSITSRNTSVFISNTTGVGQTIAQRFPGAIEYDAFDPTHVISAGTLSGPITTCERTTGDSTTGFQTTGILPNPLQNQLADIGGAYVSGVTMVDNVVVWGAGGAMQGEEVTVHRLTKTAPYADVGLMNIFRDDETMTGFKSENWTNYHDDGVGYGTLRLDLVPYYNKEINPATGQPHPGVYSVPIDTGDQPAQVDNQDVSGNGYSLNMFRMFHGENSGMTAGEGNPRVFGSDLNMIIPDPAAAELPPPAPQANPPGTVFDPDHPQLKQAFFDVDTRVAIYLDTSISFFASLGPARDAIDRVRTYLRDLIWGGDQNLADSQIVLEEVEGERWIDWFRLGGDPVNNPASTDGNHVVIAMINEASEVYHRDQFPVDPVGFIADFPDDYPNWCDQNHDGSTTNMDQLEPNTNAGIIFHNQLFTDANLFADTHDQRDNGHYCLLGFPFELPAVPGFTLDNNSQPYPCFVTSVQHAIYSMNNRFADGATADPLQDRNVSASMNFSDPMSASVTRDAILNYLGVPYPDMSNCQVTLNPNPDNPNAPYDFTCNNNTPYQLTIQITNRSNLVNGQVTMQQDVVCDPLSDTTVTQAIQVSSGDQIRFQSAIGDGVWAGPPSNDGGPFSDITAP